MWRLIISVWSLGVCVCATGDCTLVGEDGTSSYRREELAGDVGWPSGMAVNWAKNTLYFNYINSTGRITLTVLDLKNKTYTDLKGLKGRCTFTIDQHRGDVYAGCKKSNGNGGLYKSQNDGRFVVVAAEGESVQFVHYGDEALYYSSNPEYQAHTYVNGRTRSVPQLAGRTVKGLVVDGEEWIYSDGSALYQVTRETGVITRYAESEFMDCLVVSPHGVVYMCDYSGLGIYRADADTKLRPVVNDVNCFGLTIDANGNFIYADWSNNKIFRLIRC